MALVTFGLDPSTESLPWPTTQLFVWLLVGWGGWRVIADADAAFRRRGLALTLGLTLAFTAGRVAWLSRPDGPLDRPAGAARVLGEFPYKAGSTVRYLTLNGFLATAIIGPDGTRVCGEPVDPAGRVQVATLGDSFAFGLGANDGQALCDLLRERLDAALPGAARVINLGQPGANIGTYDDNARFAIEAHHADVVLVGLTIPDDLNPIDVNDFPWLIHRWWFRALLAYFDPNVFTQWMAHSQELVLPEAAGHAFAEEALTDLRDVADATAVPIGVFIFGDPWLSATWHIRVLERLDASSPNFTFLGEIHPPPDVESHHARDLHPTALGNMYFAEGALPWVIDTVRSKGAP